MVSEIVLQRLKVAELPTAVLGIVAYGRGIQDPVNLAREPPLIAIHLEDGVSLQDVFEDFEKALGWDVRLRLGPDSETLPSRQVLYLGEALTRLELTFFWRLESMVPYWISRASIKVLRDRTGILTEYVNRLPDHAESKIKAVALIPTLRHLIGKIVEGFESASAGRYAGDQGQYFYYYNSILHYGLQLHSILEGQASHWFRPVQVISRLMEDAERRFISKNLLRVNYNPDEERDVLPLRDFLDWFFDLAERVAEEYSDYALPIPLDEIVTFCETVLDRDLLWNFRPVRGPKGLFRSSRPTAYSGTPHLKQWLQDHGIKAIIDLRQAGEVEKDPPDNVLLTELEIQNYVVTLNPPAEADIHEPGYIKMLVGSRDAIRECCQIVLQQPAPVLFHCAAGKDRTGTLAAIFQLVADVPIPIIVEDYLASGVDTHPLRIKRVLDYIRDAGGIAAYLQSCGLSPAEFHRLRERITGNDS